ncbi:MAG: GIY-YIG nuclease family protein [Opitutae bacterium]|nr:GIY-YIG nuclease family protein [Opitutae bacterium]
MFSYVYILEPVSAEPRFYVGLTDDLKARLRKHNKGAVPHTAKFRPWRLKTAPAFSSRDRAVAFERYLKTSSPAGPSRKKCFDPCAAATP